MTRSRLSPDVAGFAKESGCTFVLSLCPGKIVQLDRKIRARESESRKQVRTGARHQRDLFRAT